MATVPTWEHALKSENCSHVASEMMKLSVLNHSLAVYRPQGTEHKASNTLSKRQLKILLTNCAIKKTICLTVCAWKIK